MAETSPETNDAVSLRLAVLSTAALSPTARAAIIALCNRAFGHERFTTLFDYVKDSLHVLASVDGSLVGHACWAYRVLEPEGVGPLRCAYVDAVATEPGAQRRGIGSAVMRRLGQETADCQLLALSTDSAAAFYERLGWERWRGPTAGRRPQGLQPTPNDLVLIHRTATTPALDLTALLIADDRGEVPW